MKFLEDDKLAQMTADLTDAILVGDGGIDSGHAGGGGATRIINGRIEAYTMKRVSSDKKYAHALGEKYMQEIEVAEEEMAKYQRSLGIDASEDITICDGGIGKAGSVGAWELGKPVRDNLTGPKLTGKSGPGGSRAGRKPDKPPRLGGSRRRSKSVDIGGISKASASASKVRMSEMTDKSTYFPTVTGSVMRCGAGGTPTDGVEQSTSIIRRGVRHRSSSFDSSHHTHMGGHTDTLHTHGYFSNSSLGVRLMTDLILTLNASFPDYDFSSVRPEHFIKMSTPTSAVNRINERLSEFAASLPASTHGCGSDGYTYSSQRDNGSVFLQKLWAAIDDVIVLNDCEVYSYVPPMDDDSPFGFLTETLTGFDDDKGNSRRSDEDSDLGRNKTPVLLRETPGEATLSGSPESLQTDDYGNSGISPSTSGDGVRETSAVTASMPLWTFNYFFVNKSIKRIVLFACVQTMVQTMENEMEIDLEDRAVVAAANRPTEDGDDVVRSSAGTSTPSRYFDDSPPSAIARGNVGRRQLLGTLSAGIASEGPGGYYSVSSTDARSSDDDYDRDTGVLAEDVSRPPTPATPVM